MALSHGVVIVFASRVLRTFPLGIMGVLLPIYLASIGSSIFVGFFFSLSSASSLVALLLLGSIGHRIDIRKAIIVQNLFLAAGLTLMSLSPVAVMFLLAAAISITNWAPGGGSGSGGGTYNTSLNILLSQLSDPSSRTFAFSLSSVLGAISFSAGSLLLGLVGIDRSQMIISPVSFTNIHLQSPSTLFIVAAGFQMAATVVLLFVRERHSSDHKHGIGTSVQTSGEAPVKARSVISVIRQAHLLIVAEFSNGLGNGIFIQLVPLWFYLRFQASLAAIGAIFASVGVIAAVTVLISSRLESRLGGINLIFITRSGSAALLVVTAVAPTLTAALIPYLLSVVLIRLAVPIQQSFLFSRIDSSEWTRAASMVAIANVVGLSLGPVLGAFLLLDVDPALPFISAFPLLLISSLIYKLKLSSNQRTNGPHQASEPLISDQVSA